MGNGSLHSLHQVGAVDKGFYHHTFGQRLLYLIDTLLHVLDDLLEVLTLQMMAIPATTSPSPFLSRLPAPLPHP